MTRLHLASLYLMAILGFFFASILSTALPSIPLLPLAGGLLGAALCNYALTASNNTTSDE